MPKKSLYDEEFEYDDDDYEDLKKGVRRLRREPEKVDKKKWDRESYYNRDHDYDERR